MTSEDIRSELEKEPFVPFRLHLVSGDAVDVIMVGQAEMLQNSVLVFQREPRPNGEILYDVIALRNIERLEQLGS
jgi:hypothetical protein